jgi:hypothetical protein
MLDGVAPQCTVRGPGVAARGCIAPSPIVLDAHRPSGTLGCPLFRRPAVKRHRLDASRRGVEHPVRHGLDGAQPSWQGLGHPVTPPRRRAPSEDGIDGTWPSSPLARWTFPARRRRVPRCAAFSGAWPSSTAQRGCLTARSRRVPVLVVFYGQQPSSTASSDIMRLAAWSSQSTRKDTIFMGVEPNVRLQARAACGASLCKPLLESVVDITCQPCRVVPLFESPP